MFAYTGLCLTLITWAAGAYLLTNWRNPEMRTLSRHAASAKPALVMFAVVLVTCAVLMAAWLTIWLQPRLMLGELFRWTALATCLCLALTALIPDIPGWSRRLHQWTAYSMAVLFMPLAAMISNSPHLHPAQRIITKAGVIYLIATFIIFVIFGFARRYFLQFQTAYIICFQIILLIAAYS